MDVLDVVHRAGLKGKEAALLFKVTKPTIYNWHKGRVPKIAMVFDRAVVVCKLIEQALEAGTLPLASDVKAGDRMALINKILIDTQQKNKQIDSPR